MATGTGKTYTAFQIIWRLWKSKTKKRILYLADRNILADQTKTNDFKPFGQAMTKITNRTVDKAFEIYLCLYQAVTGTEEEQNIYKQFSPDFFDLIVVDECHRGSAAEDSAWREILTYFSGATQIGLTATPKETKDVSNIEYFGEPVYTYSLKQGIADGFLAPYKVVRIGLDKDLDGWRPEAGKLDKYGFEIEDREYNIRDMDRNLVLDQRTERVAAKITEFLRATNRYAKTIVFCENIDHAERMRQALVNANPDLAAANSKYVMRITGDNDEGKAQLDNFIDPESTFPVIATTSQLMSTGVDAQTCHLIVLDKRINSMTEFKQIIGRGTRINEDYDKLFFTIMDFKQATALFADPDFDGDPVQIYEPGPDEPPVPPDDPPVPADGGADGSGDPIVDPPPPIGTPAEEAAERRDATTSTTSRSPLPPSASNTSMPTGALSPNHSRTTPARPCTNLRLARRLPHRLERRRPEAGHPRRAGRPGASSSTNWPSRSAATTTPSISSATSPSTSRRSRAENAPMACRSAMFSASTEIKPARCSKPCSPNTPTAASRASSRWRSSRLIPCGVSARRSRSSSSSAAKPPTAPPSVTSRTPFTPSRRRKT